MRTANVIDDIFWLGIEDPQRRTFDVVIPIPWGTTYNAYLIKAERPALVETVHANFREPFVEKLKELIDPLKLQYVILNHTEPDHSGALPWVLEVAPNARVVASKAAGKHVHSFFNLERDVIEAGDGMTLDLGGGRVLKFISAPFLHWPDTMFTYDAQTGALFTCDAFASHYCRPGAVFDDEAGDFSDAFRYYYEHIMAPFRDKVAEAIHKIDGLEIKVLCTGHGPVLRQEPRRYIELYREWAARAPRRGERPLAAVFFASTYGNTAQMAEQIARGLDAGGVDVALRDVTHINEAELISLIDAADGFLVGSPTIMGDAVKPIWDVLAAMGTRNVRGRPAAAFGSYGWSGEAVQMVESRLKDIGLDIVSAGLEVNFAPDEEAFEACRQLGREFAEAIKARKSS